MTEQGWKVESVAARLPRLRRRAALAVATRAFFMARGYLEVETPYVVRTPGEEVHLRAFRTDRIAPDGVRTPLWLHTSPEFGMKKLLAAKAGRIFQLARVWRNEEGSDTHAPEFTMLEWYRPGATLDDLMDESEGYLQAVLPPEVTCRGVTTRLDRCERITVAEAFNRYAGLDVLASVGNAGALAAAASITLRHRESWEDLFFRIMLARVEPRLGQVRPTFLTEWPTPLAALARRKPADDRVVERFELYICGMELANAFVELIDADEQRERFLADRVRRRELYPIESTEEWPVDEELLSALAGNMPDCAGIALGFDRLVMIATSAARITDVLSLSV